jgi:hypothetical protein
VPGLGGPLGARLPRGAGEPAEQLDWCQADGRPAAEPTPKAAAVSGEISSCSRS